MRSLSVRKRSNRVSKALVRAATRDVLRTYADRLRNMLRVKPGAVLAVLVAAALGAGATRLDFGRPGLTPEAPTKGIQFHGSAGASGALR